MADRRQEIVFQKTMSFDKRRADAAYLIKNVFGAREKGLYPSKDYVLATNYSNTHELIDIIGSRNGEDPYIVTYDTDRYKFYRHGSSTPVATYVAGLGDIRAIAFGGKGNNTLYFVDVAKEEVYELGTSSSSPSLVGAFSNFPGVSVGVWDGLYFWWIGDEIWRQLEGGVPELMMSDTGSSVRDVRFVSTYEQYLIIHTSTTTAQATPEAKVFFYDKSNTTFFEERAHFKNSVLLAGGVVDDTPILVLNRPERGNGKEGLSAIVVLTFDGVAYRERNSIRGGRQMLKIPTSQINGTTCRAGENYMLFSVDDNDSSVNTDLFNNFVYKVFPDGSIQVETPVTQNSSSANYAQVVYTGFPYNMYGVDRAGGVGAKAYVLDDTQTGYDNYTDFTQTEYITNFLCNPYNTHALTAMDFSFEKLFKNGARDDEKLEVYARTSDREAFVLLGEVTPDLVIANVNKRIDMTGLIPVPAQSYQITKMPDNNALPEFNEIQFKFKSLNGFSIIGCWFEYDYITRNTRK